MRQKKHEIVELSERTHVSFRIDGALNRRMRAAVRALRGAPAFLVLDDVAEQALEKAVGALEKKYNAGEPFA